MRESTGDIPVIQFNGQTITPDCGTLTSIPVTGSDAVYDFGFFCATNSSSGNYQRGKIVNPQQDFVEAQIYVTQDGITTIEARPATVSNGITFKSDTLHLSTSYSPRWVRLYASGTPINTGDYTYNLSGVDCFFEITVTSDLGTFENPAKSCLAIYQEDNTRTDGEYWIQQRSGSRDAVKTYCDMTHGGYTLIWSFSERSVRERYSPAIQGMSMYTSGMYISADRPQNIVTSGNDTINMFNYRLAGPTMQNVKQNASTPSEYRVRIAYNPKNMTDAWGEENYFHVQPQSATYDFIASTKGNDYTFSAGTYVKTQGKLFGRNFDQTTAGLTVVYDGYSQNALISAVYYGRTPYVNHWDVGFRLENRDRTVPVTRHDGLTANITLNPHHFDNIFGAINEDEIDHHIGKCVPNGTLPTAVADYGNANARCSYLLRYPHSFNMNPSDSQYEGRIIQWFVK